MIFFIPNFRELGVFQQNQNSTSDLWFPTSGLLLFSRLGSHEISHLVTQGLHLGL